MVKLVYCLRRLPDLSLEEFQRYWRGTHGPLVRKHSGVLCIKRYIQTHTLDTPANEMLRRSREAGEPFDGVAELWFEKAEDLAESTATPEGRQAALELMEDERNFIDFKRSVLWLAQEHPIVEP